MSQTKTYVLLPHTEGTANVFIQANATQRVRLKKRRLDHAYLTTTFVDYDGTMRTIRYKVGCNEIDQDKQIKLGILANEKFTAREKESVRFSFAALTTNNGTLQKYLESSPQFDKFWQPDNEGRKRSCDDIPGPLYTLLDETAEALSNNELFKRRLRAGNRIDGLNLEEAKNLLYRIHGTFYRAPKTGSPQSDLIAAQNALVDVLDDANDEIIDMIIDGKVTVDDQITILIGRALEAGVLDFDKEHNWVVKIDKTGKAMKLKEVSSAHPPQERRRLFAEFLSTPDGRLLKEDLERDIKPKTKTETPKT